MKSATVSMSTVAASGRMDAGFHVALYAAQDEIARLKTKVSETEAVALATDIAQAMSPSQLYQALDVLRRTTTRHRPVGQQDAQAVIQAYPYLALTRLAAGLPAAIASQSQHAASAQAQIEKLTQASAMVAPRANTPRGPGVR